jgi:hypothetical protein
MKLNGLAITLLLAGSIAAPVYAESIQCYRDSDVISCPGFGSFNYRQSGNYNSGNYNNNGNYNNQNSYNELNRIYQEVLGRNIDRNGQRTYTDALNRGRSLDDIRREVANSNETDRAIDNVYRQILGRSADRNGISTYKNLLVRGGTLDQVRRELANSDEARNRRY